MKAVAYCRVSTNKEEQLDSLESQRRFFQEYAKNNSYDLINIYADEGKSGTRIKNRMQLQQLLSDAGEGMFELVLIKDVSRLARNTVDFLISIRNLKSYGIKVVFINYDQTSSDSSEFMLTMLSAIAQEESANTSKRVKFGKKINAKNGKVPNFCYGYDKINGDYFNLYINEEEAKIVRRIFNMYTKDQMGSASIAKELNEKGIKTKRNCKWTQTGVIRVLCNEIYTGQVINGKEEVVDFLTGRRVKKKTENWVVINNSQLQIVSQDIFDKAGLILNRRKERFKKTKRRTSFKHVFSKLINCSHCGYHYRRIVRKYKNTYIRWVCNGRNSNGVDSCPNNMVIDEERLLISIKDYCLDILLEKPKYKKRIMDEFYKKNKENNQGIICERSNKNRLNKLQLSRNKYIELFKEDIISIDELENYIEEMQEEVNYINNKMKLTGEDGSSIELVEKASRVISRNLDKFIQQYQFTNGYIGKIIERIMINKEGRVDIYIVDIESICELKESKPFL